MTPSDAAKQMDAGAQSPRVINAPSPRVMLQALGAKPSDLKVSTDLKVRIDLDCAVFLFCIIPLYHHPSALNP